MRVLGIDTATTGCSAAVWSDGRVLARRADTLARGQAERLVPMVLDVMGEAGLAMERLDRIAVTVGPGAFTGIRIALAAARGFALATGVPVIGITTFEAVAHAVPAAERAGRTLAVAVDSRRAEPYLRCFGAALEPLGDPVMLPPSAVAGWLPDGPLLLAGDGAPLLREALAGRAETGWSASPGVPDAAVVAALAAVRAVGDGAPPRPFYLRPPDVTLPRGAA